MRDWRLLLQSARAGSARLRAAWEAPQAAQKAMLLRVLRENAGTTFARRHGFAAIEDISAFRRRVPIRDYDAYAPWIAREAQGRHGALTQTPPLCFEETSGSAGARKLIPYTQTLLDDFRAGALPWLDAALAHVPQDRRGALYIALSPATRAARLTQGGAPIGMPDAAYLGPNLGAALLRLLAVPPNVAAIDEVDEWRRGTLAALVACKDLSVVSVWSPTFLTALLDALPHEAEAIARRLTREDRARLARALAGGDLDARILWPSLALISCWTDGPSHAFARALETRCGGAPLHAKGLMATEACVTTPLRFDNGAESRAPALLSAFLEFLDDADTPRGAHELREGDTYRVVVTTSGGLYRYALGDAVRCEGFANAQGVATPDIAFVARDHVSDLVGEKLSEAFAAQALRVVPAPAALRARASPAGYELLVECDAAHAPLALWRDAVETALCANPHYAHARAMRQLHPLDALVTSRLSDLYAPPDARIATVKPRALIR